MYIHHRNSEYSITKGIHLTSFFKQTKIERLLQGMLKVQSSIKYKNASHSEIIFKTRFFLTHNFRLTSELEGNLITRSGEFSLCTELSTWEPETECNR